MSEDVITALTSCGELPDEFIEYRMMVHFHCLDREVIRRMPEAEFQRIRNFMRAEKEAARINAIDPTATP